jgi:rod shape-determining protein MreC
MGDFFKSLRFKILLGLLVVLVAFMIRAAYMGGLGTMASYVLGVAATPFQKLSASISYSVTNMLDTLFRAGDYKSENEALKEEIRNLRQQLVDYESAIQENEQYKQFLEIKENNQDFQVELAAVIGRSPDARFGSVTIDKGSIDGIELRDPVITADGLVGYISEVGPTYSQVITILDPTLHVGVSDVRTRDTGIVEGTVPLSEQGRCKMSYIDRGSAVAKGDIVTTSGVGGVFPKGLMIGTVNEVQVEPHGTSLYAVLEPAVDIYSIKDVVVITEFEGQTREQIAPGQAKAQEKKDAASSEGDGDSREDSE